MKTFFILSLSIAGAAVLWRTLQVNSPKLQQNLQKLPKLISKALTCGSCFTYWLSLAAVIFIHPFPEWNFLWRFSTPFFLQEILYFLIEWLSVSIAAVTIRFAYVAIQELVSYQTHILLSKEVHEHKH